MTTGGGGRYPEVRKLVLPWTGAMGGGSRRREQRQKEEE